MRKKTNNKDLAKRAKELVRKWQIVVNQSTAAAPVANISHTPTGGNLSSANGVRPPYQQTMQQHSATIGGAPCQIKKTHPNGKLGNSASTNNLPSYISSPAASLPHSTTTNDLVSCAKSIISARPGTTSKQSSPLPPNLRPATPVTNSRPVTPAITPSYSAHVNSRPSTPIGEQAKLRTNPVSEKELYHQPALINDRCSPISTGSAIVINGDVSKHKRLPNPSPTVSCTDSEEPSRSGKRKRDLSPDAGSPRKKHHKKSKNSNEGKERNGKHVKRTAEEKNSKTLNGLKEIDHGLESNVFSCKVSSDELKCTIRMQPPKPMSPTVSQSIKTPSVSTVTKPVTNRSTSKLEEVDGTPKTSSKGRKAETTAQLIQKLHSNGSIRLVASQTICEIANNKIVKEEVDDKSVVPAGAKPRPHKKRSSKLQPPSTSVSELNQVKTEMVHKYLNLSMPVQPHRPPSPAPNNDLKKLLKKLEPEPEEVIDVVSTQETSNSAASALPLDENSEEYRTALLRSPWKFLPPLPESIDWDNEQEEPLPPIAEATEENVDRVINGQWLGVNGQLDYQNNFQKWTETYSVPSYRGDLLHILPYCSLDF